MKIELLSSIQSGEEQTVTLDRELLRSIQGLKINGVTVIFDGKEGEELKEQKGEERKGEERKEGVEVVNYAVGEADKPKKPVAKKRVKVSPRKAKPSEAISRLTRYLKSTGKTRADFCRESGVPTSTLANIAAGYNQPGKLTASRIEKYLREHAQ